ncbi:MAG: gamma-glutamylcyclotransferase [Planctomycetales bacterium]|nr:gamma-glutamylcyclotransferase [Planctomycetales bacterium]
MSQQSTNLFVYGTLLVPAIMQRVAGERLAATAGVLHGYVRKTVRGEVFPAIKPSPTEAVEGQLYWRLGANAIRRLDAFEGPLYQRVEVNIELGEGVHVAADTYVIALRHETWMTDIDWSLEEFRRSHRDEFERQRW